MALGLALLENWALWGFWLSRPSLVAELEGANRLVGISAVGFTPVLARRSRDERTEFIAAAKVACHPRHNYLCFEGQLVRRLEPTFGALDAMSDVEEPALQAVWTDVLSGGWLAQAKARKDPGIGAPTSGLAIQFQRRGQAYLLLAYRTSEIGDTYGYSEVLYAIGEAQPHHLREIHFFYDIAGVEGFEWPVLWPLNLLPAWMGWRLLRRRLGPAEYTGGLLSVLLWLGILWTFSDFNPVTFRHPHGPSGLLVLTAIISVAGALAGRHFSALCWASRSRP